MILRTKSALDALWRTTLNAKEVITRSRPAILGPKIGRSRRTLFHYLFFFLKVISKFEVTWPESRCASYSRYCTPKLRHFRIMPTDRTALRFYLTAIRHVLSRAMLKLRWASSRVSFRNTGPVRLTRGGWKYIYEMIYYNKWFKSNASCGLDLM